MLNNNFPIIDIVPPAPVLALYPKTYDGRMYSLGEVNFIQGMLDFGNPKNSVGLKPALALR